MGLDQQAWEVSDRERHPPTLSDVARKERHVGSSHWTISATVTLRLQPAKGDESRQ
jgi:hypothetical protein